MKSKKGGNAHFGREQLKRGNQPKGGSLWGKWTKESATAWFTQLWTE